MWTRAELKDKAKAFLRIYYWQAFLVSLVIAFFSGRGGGGGAGGSERSSYKEILQEPALLLFFVALLVFIFIIVLSLRIFLGYPLEVGGRRFFVRGDNGDVSMNYLGYGFTHGYSNIVKTMFWRDILNFLFFLLLIIPGIIKAYAYRMVPYILADNPKLEYYRAIDISERMTYGIS